MMIHSILILQQGNSTSLTSPNGMENNTPAHIGYVPFQCNYFGKYCLFMKVLRLHMKRLRVCGSKSCAIPIRALLLESGKGLDLAKLKHGGFHCRANSG
mmetsp:Transcript_17066/g.29374  ORF Transcript_17066/g.29374 Transcript_17066/m.29374 type:complete len:99 (-) Transcript_17066:435-731(-)